MGKSSKPQTVSGLSQDQQDISNILRDMLVMKDRNGPDHKGLGYGLMGQPATPYNGALTATLNPAYGSIMKVIENSNPLKSNSQTMATLSPLLQGQRSGLLSSLQSRSTLNLNDLQAPTVGNGNYNYSPQQVKSSLDVKDFTKKYFQDSVMAPLLREYDQTIAPRIEDSAAAAGNTFSTRTQLARQRALSDLQATATGKLADAARQDELVRADQNLQSQMFNSNNALNNAQFGANLGLNYDQLRSQNALNFGNLNTQRALGAFQANSQNQQFYDQLNTNTNLQMNENAMNRRLQAAALGSELMNQPLQQAGMIENLLAPFQQNRENTVSAQYNEFMRTRPENSPWLKTGMALLGSDPNTIAYQPQSPLAQGAQGALGGLATAGALAGTGLGAAVTGAGLGGPATALLGVLGALGL